MFNPAVYASRLDSENRRDATRIELDAHGNVVNPVNQFSNPWAEGAIRDARERRSFEVYADAMSFLDSVIGSDRDTETVNAFNHAMSKFQSTAHAEAMMEKLQIAAGGRSNAALIAFAAASIYVNPFSHVNFSWYSPAPLAVAPARALAAAPDAPVPVPTPEIVINTFSPPLLLSGPIAAPAPIAPLVTPLTIFDEQGRHLTATATGWQAESKSQPGTIHTTSADGSRCNCPGFAGRYRKCWHTALVCKHISDQQRQERERALPISRRRRGKSRMWK